MTILACSSQHSTTSRALFPAYHHLFSQSMQQRRRLTPPIYSAYANAVIRPFSAASEPTCMSCRL
jgi:hypothetical protein